MLSFLNSFGSRFSQTFLDCEQCDKIRIGKSYSLFLKHTGMESFLEPVNFVFTDSFQLSEPYFSNFFLVPFLVSLILKLDKVYRLFFQTF